MIEIDIFQYQSARQFLLDKVAFQQKTSTPSSVRVLARQMGMKSHALLVMLLKGQRPIRLKHAKLIAQGFDLSFEEHQYLQGLIEFESSTSHEERAFNSLRLAELNPGLGFRTREVDDYNIVSHWIHTAILAMTDIPDFDGSEEQICRRLGKRAGRVEIRAALERLLSAGLLTRTPDGRIRVCDYTMTTRDDILNEGVRAYHRLASGLAAEAVEREAMEDREFQSFSVAVNRDQIPVAKALIRKFRAQFYRAMRSESATDVFQMNLQFFQLTESPSRLRHEDEGVDTE